MLREGRHSPLEVNFERTGTPEDQVCPYCSHRFTPWRLPASGEFAKSCPFCAIIALHLFNKTPMPQWLADYRRGHAGLSGREYTEAVVALQKLLGPPGA